MLNGAEIGCTACEKRGEGRDHRGLQDGVQDKGKGESVKYGEVQ